MTKKVTVRFDVSRIDSFSFGSGPKKEYKTVEYFIKIEDVEKNILDFCTSLGYWKNRPYPIEDNFRDTEVGLQTILFYMDLFKKIDESNGNVGWVGCELCEFNEKIRGIKKIFNKVSIDVITNAESFRKMYDSVDTRNMLEKILDLLKDPLLLVTSQYLVNET
jgi:hypothetical protein